MIENQKQRWLKYGANVAISSALVIALAGMLVYLVQQRPRRIDTTAAGLYSLKPQTISVIQNNPAPVKLVSLYRTRDSGAVDEQQQAQVVRDLLLEYQRKGRNVSVEFIDPRTQPAKEDALIREVEQKYGGEIAAYKSFLDGYDAQHAQIVALCSAEVEALTALAPPSEVDRATLQTFRAIAATVRNFPTLLEDIKEQVERERKRRIPDYQACTAAVRSGVDGLRERVDAIIARVNESRAGAGLPEPLARYLADSLPRYERIREVCDGVIRQVDALGELKLDTLRRSLQQRDPILVLGASDLRILPFEQGWREQVDRPTAGAAGNVAPKPRFAGEQMITSAIVAVNQPRKRTVAFVRAGGAPLTEPGFEPLIPGGPLWRIAERLRDYNFEVVERDLTGQWAVQAQMRGMPSAAEATDEQLKEAIWVVVAFPPDPRMPTPPSALADELRKHLDAGGSALALVEWRGTGLEPVLKPYGIEPRPDLIAVHESIAAPDSGRSTDEVVDAQRLPFIFVLDEHGDHAITRPLRSLDLLLVPAVPVVTSAVEGVSNASILPLPNNPPAWGEADTQDLQTDTSVSFDANAGDMPGPIAAGAVAEKLREGAARTRLVVIGSAGFASNLPLTLPDAELERQGVYVTRFPGNGELFMNAIFWLAGMDTMIAISPAAMEVSRIRPMSAGLLNFWRVGVLLIGIPGAVIAAGLMVYLKRRD